MQSQQQTFICQFHVLFPNIFLHCCFSPRRLPASCCQLPKRLFYMLYWTVTRFCKKIRCQVAKSKPEILRTGLGGGWRWWHGKCFGEHLVESGFVPVQVRVVAAMSGAKAGRECLQTPRSCRGNGLLQNANILTIQIRLGRKTTPRWCLPAKMSPFACLPHQLFTRCLGFMLTTTLQKSSACDGHHRLPSNQKVSKHRYFATLGLPLQRHWNTLSVSYPLLLVMQQDIEVSTKKSISLSCCGLPFSPISGSAFSCYFAI